jgi:hypothetical protein
MAEDDCEVGPRGAKLEVKRNAVPVRRNDKKARSKYIFLE